MKTEDKNEEKNVMKEVAPFMGLGFQLAATIVLMIFLGKYLDGKLDTYPILTVVFAFLGGVAGIYHTIKSVLQINKKK